MDKPIVRGIICDLDGVLVDSEGLHARAWEEVFIRRGAPVPGSIRDRFIGVTDAETSVVLIGDTGLKAEPDQILSEKRIIYAEFARAELRPFPGLAEILKDMAELDTLRLGVATSSRRESAEMMLEKSGLAPYFRVVVTSNDVKRTKPAPDSYARACTLIGVHPGETAAVEDSPAGARSARDAGLYVLGVTTTSSREALDACHEVVDTPARALEKLWDYHLNSITEVRGGCCA